MRHRVKGRKLNRNSSHRKAMFSNMAASLIKTLDESEAENAPKVNGRIITTVPKAKELRPRVEKLITLAKRAAKIAESAQAFATDADRGSDAWKEWRHSEQWQKWNQAIAPAVTLRRRAFAVLRDQEAVDILFGDLAEKFADRNGGYLRIVRIAAVRLGDAGEQALIEFVGKNDRVKKSKTKKSLAVKSDAPTEEAPAADEPAAVEDAPAAEEASSEETAESTEATDQESGEKSE
jgi:large subunit ribosomal protein L17